MAVNLTIKGRIFNEKYKPYVTDYSNRYEVWYGGAGSGKSHFVFQKMVIKAMRDRRKILVIRKVANTLRNSVFQLTKDTLAQFKILDLCKVNISNMSIVLPNGSEFIFLGLEDVERLKSIVGITDVVIEEATEISQDDFLQIDLRLRSKAANQQIIIMFNPISKLHWLYTFFFENPKENTLIVKSTYRDNRFLNEDYVKAILRLKDVDRNLYNVYAEGEFGVTGQKVYNNFSIDTFDKDEVRRKFHNVYGLDFGYSNDPTALVAAAVDKINKVIYIYDEHYQSGMLNSTIADLIKLKGYAKENIIADAAEQKSIEEIKRAGIPRIEAAKKGRDSVNWGIQRIKQYKIVVHSDCTNAAIEFQNYTYKKDNKTGLYTDTPVDAYNHILDALRYAMEKLEPQKVGSMSKSAWGL